MEPPYSILYVEDNIKDQELTRKAFAKQSPHIRFSMAETIDDARKLLTQCTFEIVLVDYSLPDGDGIELISWIQDAQLPCAAVMVTAHGDEVTASRALKVGAEDFVSKQSGYLQELPKVVEQANIRFKERDDYRRRPFRVLYCGADLAVMEKTEQGVIENAPYIRLQFTPNGAECLALMEAGAFDALVIEAKLPDMTGLSLYKSIVVRNNNLPVIMVASRRDEHLAVHCFRLGFAGYLSVHGDFPIRLALCIEKVVSQFRLVERERQLRKEISQRRKTEIALRESEERYRLLFEHADDMISVYDRRGVCQLMNHRVAALFGGTPQDFIGKSFHDLHPDMAEEYTRRISSAIDAGISTEYEDEVIFPQAKRLLKSRVNPIPDAKGVFRTAQIISHDITEHRQIEEDKLQLEQQFHQVQKMEAIGTLASGVAHDFNNILFAISGYTELSLQYVSKNSLLWTNLQKIRSANQRASDLVRQILTFSRKMETESQPIQPKLIIKEALALLRASLPSTIEINLKIESDAYIMGDAGHVHQIIMNLAVNAAFAMEPKGGALTVALTEQAIERSSIMRAMQPRPGRHVVITVADTGVGISEDIINRIFDPYFTTKSQEKGTGLGLATVLGIVDRYGGGIILDSKPGQGSRFDVFIPMIDGKTELPLEDDDELPTGTESILVVDDEAPLVDVCCQMIEQLGYAVTSSTSSQEALELFKSDPQRFSLLITDYTMPHMTGVELTRAVHQIDTGIPVMMISGNHEPITREMATKMGIEVLLEKPLMQKELANQIRSVLDRKPHC